MKAIETHYAGCRFRSRLEARWAVFFDALGVAWEYEPQGYLCGRIHDGDAGFAYLPDFYVPSLGCHVEVKGVLDDVTLERLCEAICPHGGGLPGGAAVDLLLLGPVPRVENVRSATPIHFGLRWSKGDVFVQPVEIGDGGVLTCVDISGYPGGTSIWCDSSEYYGLIDGPGELLLPRMLAPGSPRVAQAYWTARTARFEFGEKPFAGEPNLSSEDVEVAP